MIMRNCSGVKDTGIFAEQKAMVDIIIGAKQECDGSKCYDCPDRKYLLAGTVNCILFKYARKLYEAGFRQTEKGTKKDE